MVVEGETAAAMVVMAAVTPAAMARTPLSVSANSSRNSNRAT